MRRLHIGLQLFRCDLGKNLIHGAVVNQIGHIVVLLADALYHLTIAEIDNQRAQNNAHDHKARHDLPREPFLLLHSPSAASLLFT